MKISIVLPVYNEEGNIETLCRELKNVLQNVGDYEIIAVDDGSRDKSREILARLSKDDAHIKVINFRFNSGQTAAMSAGIKNATGDIIIPMDSDLQNDPADIPRFLAKINEGYDVVSGWRKKRKDEMLRRKIPSKIANWIIGEITGVKIHDYGCSMKAYKRDVIQGVQLYGEMHRFIPAYANWRGAKVGEIVVNHRPRTNGVTKYGLSRTFKVVLDLIVIKFLSKYMNRPIHFFGGIGFWALLLGFLTGAVSIFLKLAYDISISRTPLPILASLFVIIGIQFIVMGVLAEMLMRVYYSSGREPYEIKEKINL